MRDDIIDTITCGIGTAKLTRNSFITLMQQKFYEDLVDAMQSTYFQKIVKGNNMDHILNNISLINLHISLWQGDKALKAEDLAANGVDTSKLPPGKLASLGCKRTIGKEATKGFIALKREAHSICSRYGVKFGESGYAIPDEKAANICLALEEIKCKFITAKEEFLQTYEASVEAWINQNDYEWRDAIRNSVDPVGKVSSVLSFNFSAFKVNPVVNVCNGLEEEVGGLHAQLCKEVRTLAGVTLKTSYVGKSQVGKRALRPLAAIRNKLDAMRFLEPSISALVDEISDNLSSAFASIRHNNEGVLEGVVFNQTVGMLTKLSALGLKVEYEAVPEDTSEEAEEETEAANNELATPVVDIPDWDF